MESPAFGRGADTCSGIYYEHDPSDPELISPVHRDRIRGQPNTPAIPNWPFVNFEHEYAHYLDGRFNRHGPYRGYDDSVHWWTEGFAEYLCRRSVSLHRPAQNANRRYSLTETLLHSDSIPTLLPPSAPRRPLHDGEPPGLHRQTARVHASRRLCGLHLTYWPPKGRSSKGSGKHGWLPVKYVSRDSPCRSPYCLSSVPEYNAYWGYIARVVLGSLDHASGATASAIRFYDDTVTVQSRLHGRASASPRASVQIRVAWAMYISRGSLDRLEWGWAFQRKHPNRS